MSENLAVGIVCYASLGGSGIVASELAVGLAKRGHRVHLFASEAPSRTLPKCDRLFFHHVSAPSHPLLEHAPYAVALASAIVEVGRVDKLDVLHVHYAMPHAASAYLACQALGSDAPRLVTTLHGTDVTHFGVDPTYAAITRFTVEASDAITVPSAFLQGEARRILRLSDRTRIDVIPNFVDAAHFAPATVRDPGSFDALFGGSARAKPGPTLVHVSNFRAVKRVPDLLEVLARVRRRLPARLLLIGDGPERATAAARTQELGLEDSVCFLGQRADFVEHLKHADAFLLPSETESFGLAALEALSCGVPVFGYRIGGLPEVVTQEVGRLVPAFDVGALADSVVDVLADKATHAALARAARARALSTFQPAPALDRYEALFDRVLLAR